MKERIEDIGRIRVMLENLLDHESFRDFRAPKHIINLMAHQSEAYKDSLLESLIYLREECKTSMCDILSIARGDDED